MVCSVSCLRSLGHGMAADWWSFGVLMYELLSGTTPFYDPATYKMYEKIAAGRYYFPIDISEEAADLMKNLLQVIRCEELTTYEVVDGKLATGTRVDGELTILYRQVDDFTIKSLL